MTFNEYESDWLVFRKKIEEKAKGRCVINNKNWGKLRDYHFEICLKKVNNPYGFVFKMINLHKIYQHVPCAYSVYYRYKKKKQMELETLFRTKSRADSFRKYR
jgi:hypothetical protein